MKAQFTTVLLYAAIMCAPIARECARAQVRTSRQGSSASSSTYRWHMSLNTLVDIANDVISSDPALGKQRIIADNQTRTIMVDITPAPLGLIGEHDTHLARVAEQAIRMQALQRDLSRQFDKDAFWTDSMSRINEQIEKSLVETESAAATKNRVSGNRQEQAVEAVFSTLRDAVFAHARETGWTTGQTRDAAIGFSVEVKFEPERVHVYVMPLTAYLLSTKRNLPLDTEWTEIFEGPQKMSGTYHFKAAWPSDLHGVIEGNFDIHDNEQVIKFVPGG
jgi:hypothetical protein